MEANLFPGEWMDAMSDAVGPGDLVLCVNAAPNHVTGQPVPLVAGETYQVVMVMEFACPCGRSDALLDVAHVLDDVAGRAEPPVDLRPGQQGGARQLHQGRGEQR